MDGKLGGYEGWIVEDCDIILVGKCGQLWSNVIWEIAEKSTW